MRKVKFKDIKEYKLPFYFVSRCLCSLFTVFYLSFQSSIVSAQGLEILYGLEQFYGKPDYGNAELHKLVRDNTESHYKIRLSYPIYDGKYIIYASFHTLFPYASIEMGTEDEIDQFDERGYSLFISGGSGKTELYRYGVGLGRELGIWKKRLLFTPAIILHSEFSYETWGYGPSGGGMSGRYNYQLYSYSNPGFQILPEFVIPLHLKLFNHVYLQAEYSFFLGFRPFMYIEAEYSIDGVPQPNSRYYNDGTAHQAMIGLQFRWH